MSAQMKQIYSELVVTANAPAHSLYVFAATGLTQNGANTVPFPTPLARVPQRVLLTPVGNGAAGGAVSLDTSQGATDPTGSFAGGKLGFDQNNIYVVIGAGTQILVSVECGTN